MKKQFTILIADDNIVMRRMLRMVIENIEGASLIGESSNGEEIIGLAKQLHPDIILMDINMSPINGFEATRKVLKENPTIKIIGLSMHNKASYANNMMKLGAMGYVCKSSTEIEIVEAIQKVAGGGKYIDKNLVGNVDV